jgi:dipeptidyl aminopeptidase/acylaminoacyl peptidase
MKKSVDISYSLDTLWQSIIRPQKEKYELKDLGYNEFMSYGRNFTRKDYRIIGHAGNILQCSFYENEQSNNDCESLPVIIFCHGNSSSQKEIKFYLDTILQENINIFAFDFSGCGKSEGEYISLGYYEKKDLKIIIDFVYKLPNVGPIGLWGHSMGAATIILYAAKDPRISCICVDSSFSDFSVLLKEISEKYITIPNFVYSSAHSLVKEMVLNRNKLDIDKLKPIEQVTKIGIPTYFIHAKKDELIHSDHSLRLYEACGAFYKYINICEGGHNSIRPDFIINKIIEFFKSYLFKDKNKV